MRHGTTSRRRTSLRHLRRALDEMEEHYSSGSTPTVRHLLSPLGGEAAALGVALLALPFLSPVSLGPITTAASMLILVLGWRLVAQQERAPLPERLLEVSVPQGTHRIMSAVLRRVSRWTRRFSRPRYAQMVDGRRGRVICGAGVISGALLLAVPIPLLPLTNTFPALGILLFALGWSERDGLLTILGSLSLLLSTAVFGALGAVVAWAGWDVLHGLIPWVTGLG